MKEILQKIANFLEALSIKIEPNVCDTTLKAMNRKALIVALKKQRLKICELQQYVADLRNSQEDLHRDIIRAIDELSAINNGDLSQRQRLKVTACVMGHYADCINLIVDDLSQALQSLPLTHPLRKKYRLQDCEGKKLDSLADDLISG